MVQNLENLQLRLYKLIVAGLICFKIEMNRQCLACDKYMISDINIYVILTSFSALEMKNS